MDLVKFLKKFITRTNITYTLEITILESNLEVSGEFYTSHGHDVGKDASGIKYEYYQYSGVIYSINNSSFKNLSITASAETSTISSATGNGEVQYIAMEVD